MADLLLELGRTGGVDAIPHGFVVESFGRRATHGTVIRHDEFALITGPLGFDDRDNLGNDVTRPLHDDRIADADAQAADLFLVVERGATNDDAADLDRIEDRGGIEAAGATDVDFDVADDGRLLDCGELIGGGPAWIVRDRAELRLQLDVVHLDDDAVDLEVEPIPLF